MLTRSRPRLWFLRAPTIWSPTSHFTHASSLDVLSPRSPIGARLALVSASNAANVRQVRRQLNIAEPFVCDGGAAVHVPSAYFWNADASGIATDDWEIFRLNPPDRTAAVNLLSDLFIATGCHEVLTVGIGCDLDDYGVLTAVDVSVVVRDPLKE